MESFNEIHEKTMRREGLHREREDLDRVLGDLGLFWADPNSIVYPNEAPNNNRWILGYN